MRTSSLVFSLFVAGALSARFPKRAYTTEDFVVTTTLFVTEGLQTSSAEASIVAPSSSHRYGHRHSHASSSKAASVSTTAVDSSSASVVSTSTHTASMISTTASGAPTASTSSTSASVLSTDSTIPSSTTSSVIASTSAPPSTSSCASSGPASGGTNIIDTINKWRKIYNVPCQTWSTTLEANANKTGSDNAVQGLGASGLPVMNHQLNPGSFGQVIGMGLDSGFEDNFLGSWLCELPGPELIVNGVDKCGGRAASSNHGHHDGCLSTSYTQVGCAFNQVAGDPVGSGEWTCDFAF